jgi:Novel toxin 14
MKNSFQGKPEVTDLAKAQLEMRQRLRALGPRPSIWDSKQFSFADWLVKEYIELLKARALGKVEDVPKVLEYTKQTSTEGHGLAVSTHGDLTSRGIGAFDRESHHTSQYLLLEFFGNVPDATRQAFPPPYTDFEMPAPHKGKKGPIFSASGNGTVDAIVGSERLDIKPLNPNSGRGEGMPTILLAARTHQQGDLHVIRQKWIDDSTHKREMHGTATQGFAIENKFNFAITEKLRPRNTDRKHRTELQKMLQDEPLKASQQYYQAALETYTWMRNHMIPQLERALLTEEKAYYRGIAAQKHSSTQDPDQLEGDWDLQDGPLKKVFDAAKTNNDDVMGKYKWKAV